MLMLKLTRIEAQILTSMLEQEWNEHGIEGTQDSPHGLVVDSLLDKLIGAE